MTGVEGRVKARKVGERSGDQMIECLVFFSGKPEAVEGEMRVTS